MGSMSDHVQKKKSVSNFIPFEILEAILLRLPLKSIARFRCVSKSWQRLVRDPLFVRAHFQQFKEKKSDLNVLTAVNGKLHSLEIKSLKAEVVEIQAISEVEAVSEIIRDIGEIWGSCNGWLCLTTSSSRDYFLLNPCTWQCNIISNSKTAPDKYYIALDCGMGFGYNARLKDFEVVRWYYYGTLKTQIEVCTFGQNLWQKIIDIPYKCRSRKGKLVSGTLHWLGDDYSDPSYTDMDVIIAYDICHRKVGTIPLPESGNKKWPDIIDITVVDSYLCVFVGAHFCPSNVELWVMVDYGVRDSWMKLFTLTGDMFSRVLTPLYFVENGSEIIFCDATHIYFCEIKNRTGVVKKMKIHNLTGWTSWTATHVVNIV